MQGYIPIESVAEQLKRDYDWPHSFIREWYHVTAGCLWEDLDESGESQVFESDGPDHARIIVACSGNDANLGIEFLLKEVGLININRLYELQFDYQYDQHSGHCLRFSEDDGRFLGTYFTASGIWVKFLGKEYQRVDLRLGYEFPDEEAASAIDLGEHWKQCPKCSEAWQEIPRLEYSRCPTCGELTRWVDN